MPPAFILSQDQTLHREKPDRPRSGGAFYSFWFYAQKRGSAESLPPPYARFLAPRPHGPGHRISAMLLCFRRAARRAARIRIALSSFQGASPPSIGRRFINMPRFFRSASRLAAFFCFFDEKCRLLSCFGGRWRPGDGNHSCS